MPSASSDPGESLDIIAFKIHGRDFCLETRSIREIRGSGKSTPVPQAPPEVVGVMDLRGAVIPIIDLAVKLGMEPNAKTERSAIVVAEIGNGVVGLVVDGVSDLLTIRHDMVQPLPSGVGPDAAAFAIGIITHEIGMICYLDLACLFPDGNEQSRAA